MATFTHGLPARRMIIVACCLAGLICAGCTSGPVGTPTPTPAPAGWQMPVDPNGGANATHKDWMEFAWQSFLALNWPAQAGGTPGQPDTGQTLAGACPKPGDPVAQCIPTVWMGYLNSDQVFLPSGANPGTWAQPTQPLPMKPDPATGQMIPVLGGLSKATAADGPDEEFDEAGTNSPLIDQNAQFVLFEVELNQSEFTYILNNGYYDANNQKAAFPPNQPSTFKSFPDGVNNMPADLPAWAQFGATEVKASWRILQTDPNKPNPDIVSRYFTRRAFFELPDGTVSQEPVTLGLVGLHILRLTPSSHSTWFWATFEQVDNIEITQQPIPTRPNGQPLTPSFGPCANSSTCSQGFSYQPAEVKEGGSLPAPTPVGVSRVTALPTDVVAINNTFQRTLSGTVWQYYQLVNTLNPQSGGPCTLPNNSNNVGLNACEMVNTTMETYTQVKTNCVSCHAFAIPQGAPQNNPDFQIFTFLLGNAQPSTPAGQAPAECMGCHGSVAPLTTKQ